MDKKIKQAYLSKIKELKKQIRDTHDEALYMELEVIEDAYSFLQTDYGWKRYLEVQQ